MSIIGLEQRIYKIRKWQNIITAILECYKTKDRVKYKFICLKYFKKLTPIKIPDKTDNNNPFENLKRDYNNLNNAINKLTPEQRYVIINYYFKNKTLSKIAKKLNSNVNAVNQLKLRAVLSLRRYMEE